MVKERKEERFLLFTIGINLIKLYQYNLDLIKDIML